MKRLLFVIALLLLAVPAMAADVTFAWDYGTPMPSGFEMTLTQANGAVSATDCGAATDKQCKVSSLPAGTYSAYVRAYNIGSPATLRSYSPPSNTVSFTVPSQPATPANMKITVIVNVQVN